MDGSITVRFGSFEISCAGSEDFVEKNLPTAIALATDAYAALSLNENKDDVPSKEGASKTPPTSNEQTMSVSTISAKLKVNSGPELVIAACYSLQAQGKTQCKRSEIVDEMRQASSYFKGTYINNLSAYLKGLIQSGKLLEQKQGVFALNPNTYSTLESQLASS